MGWKESYLKLLEFKHKHGHIRLPKSDSDLRRLSKWVQQQQARHAVLNSARIRKLLDLGVTFGARDTAWYKQYFELVDFKRNKGEFPSGRLHIARWLEYQRRKGNAGRLAPYQTRLLNRIGMIWRFNIFEKRLVELKEFYAEHGHSNVPWNYPLNPGLGHYVCNALRGGKDKLAARQIRELNALGFIWDVREAVWQRRFVELKEFLAKNKTYPTRVTNSSLASWVKSQRKIAQSQQHVGQLNCIDFPWHPNEENWLKRYSELKEFKKQFGHCQVPSNNPKFHQLWDWLNYQKKQRNSITSKRLHLLQQVCSDWSDAELFR